MMRLMEVSRAARKGVVECARLEPGENVLILADTAIDRGMVDAFANAAYAHGGDTQVMVFETRPDINVEPPRAVAAAMAASDLVIDLTSQYFIHTVAYQKVRDGGARILCATGISEDMLVRLVGSVDYAAMASLGHRVTQRFVRGHECRVETGQGAVLTMQLGGRPAWLRDGILGGKGDLDYLPGAQMSIAPIEESVEGVILIDGTAYPPVKLLASPMELEYQHGRLVRAEGGAAAAWMQWLGKFSDPKMFFVGHVSVGLNSAAKLSGAILEDERLPGCFDIGMGSQMKHLAGRLGKAASHSDVVATAPRILVDGELLADRGQFLV
jgi:leucyl aminopeptidase (aminopeptidase T)